MEITLIRHTSVNIPKGMIYGQTEVSLNKTFEEEATETLNKITDKFDIIYSSPMTRCQLLAQKIAPEIICDNRLKELNFGNWEGKFWNDIDQTEEAKKWFADYINTPCPAGESYQDLINRIQSFYSEIINSEAKRICIVTHGGPIRAFISIIERITPQEAFNRKINYGEVIQYTIKQ